MKTEKKVTDLIYIEPQKTEVIIAKEFKDKVYFWLSRLKSLQEQYFDQKYDSASQDVTEVMSMRRFLTKFLMARVDWITENVKDPALRLKYLNVLPPFPQKGGIKTLLTHFFQVVETDDKKALKYRGITELEKEVRLLWDIYKLRKTIESIEVLEKALNEQDPFPSIFSIEARKECLSVLKGVFKLMFQVCLQPEFRKELYNSISPKHVSPEAILKRKESGQYYVYKHVFEKFDYRNQFFFIYYSTGMKAKIGGQTKEYLFNYLDFEVMKQEFLINWLNKKLKGNPKKFEIYKNYSIEGRTLFEIISENPAREIEILKQIPINVFNDLTAQINEEVSSEDRTKMEAFSENHGEFAESTTQFKKAKQLAKQSVEKIREVVSQIIEKPKPKAEPPPPEPVPEPEPEKPVVPTYKVTRIKKNEIDYPYFQKTLGNYPQKLALQRVKSDKEKYIDFIKRMTKMLNNINESVLITRRTPKHEWVIPYTIKETVGEKITEHFLIIGAEVKSKQLSMGYSAKATQSNYAFTCYWLYGKSEMDPAMGKSTEKRNIKGREYFEFDFANAEAQKKAYQMFDIVMDNS
ncbi:MAG: hypothetical protein OEY59_06455 [Deltaproteobacteria bacterium]|nr:hypothetical protein [Deltaproteobacteria bacterium]